MGDQPVGQLSDSAMRTLAAEKSVSLVDYFLQLLIADVIADDQKKSFAFANCNKVDFCNVSILQYFVLISSIYFHPILDDFLVLVLLSNLSFFVTVEIIFFI